MPDDVSHEHSQDECDSCYCPEMDFSLHSLESSSLADDDDYALTTIFETCSPSLDSVLGRLSLEENHTKTDINTATCTAPSSHSLNPSQARKTDFESSPTSVASLVRKKIATR